MRKIILWVLVWFFVIVSHVMVHELMHQYNFKEIDEVCFFGYGRSPGGFMYTSVGWVIADNYFNAGELWPTVVGIAYAVVVFIALVWLFRHELYGGNLDG